GSSGYTAPVRARTCTLHDPVGPVAHDCVKLIFIRHGSAILLSEFGEKPVSVGDVVALGANTLRGSEPEGFLLRPGFGAGSDSRKDEGLWQHRGSTARSCGSGFQPALSFGSSSSTLARARETED